MKTTPRFLTILALSACIGSAAYGANISLDFEGATPGTSPPSGWSLIGTGDYATGSGGNPGQKGSFTWSGSPAKNQIPQFYLVNDGVAFDATQPISGSFDYFFVEPSRIDDHQVNFVMGDVQDGISGNAGELINYFGRERTFGRRSQLTDGAGSVLFNGDGNNTYRNDSNIWITASFDWTPTSGTTGDFSIEWDGPSPTGANRGPMTANGFTFDSNEVFFGFGTGRDDAELLIDNISIDGTEIVIPEPSVALLGGLGSLLLLLRRRR